MIRPVSFSHDQTDLQLDIFNDPIQTQRTCCQNLTDIFWLTINGLEAIFQTMTSPIYALFDEGLANVLGLEVLRHGTSFPNYVSIMTYGADPNYGGSDGGSSRGIGMERYVESSRNYFHVFRDSNALAEEISTVTSSSRDSITGEQIYTPYREEITPGTACMRVVGQLANRVMPTMHATLSGITTFVAKEETGCCTVIKKVAGGILGFLTPTLRFKFTQDGIEQQHFEHDVDYGGLAWRTKDRIGPEHLGITGSLIQGLNFDVICRIAENPLKFLLGLIQLIAAVALALFAITAVTGIAVVL